MKHTITKTEQGYVCQAVNPYAESSAPNTGKARISSVNMDKLRRKQFSEANPPFHFIHPDPLPDNAIVDGEDLTEPFGQVKWPFDGWLTKVPEVIREWKRLGYQDHRVRMAISFKHPELMACVDGVFIRKEQIKNPRFEARSKEISQEVRDRVDNYTPQPDTNFDQLYDILVDYESGEITINEAIDLISGTDESSEQRYKDALLKIKAIKCSGNHPTTYLSVINDLVIEALKPKT